MTNDQLHAGDQVRVIAPAALGTAFYGAAATVLHVPQRPTNPVRVQLQLHGTTFHLSFFAIDLVGARPGSQQFLFL